MTYQKDFTLQTELLEQAAEEDLDFIPERIWIAANISKQMEHQKYLGVFPYELALERHGHSNSLKPN